MRGKKNDVDSYYNDYELYPLESEKRASMGFHGTRGKRSDDRFFGIRDKRNVRNAALQGKLLFDYKIIRLNVYFF